MAPRIPFTLSILQEGEGSAACQRLYVLGKCQRQRGMSGEWFGFHYSKFQVNRISYKEYT